MNTENITVAKESIEAQEWRGMPVVKSIAQRVSERMESLKGKGIIPTLAVIRVGAREDDLSYERGIIKRFEAVGAKVLIKELPLEISQEELEKVISECNRDVNIHGILLFRPLPKHIDEKKVTELVNPKKDVDCMTMENYAHTFMQDGKGYEPCTARAVIEMLDFYGCDLTGKRVVVIGRSMVVGKPLSVMLQKRNATVIMCHTKTENLAKECREADIICACAGVAGMVSEDYISENQIIIDVGINVVDGNLCGDVDREAGKSAKYVTPVPGGVGTVTTSVLLLHTVKGAEIVAEEK